MKFEELTILLPCHSFEDFPLHHEGDEAEGLLAGWTAMWHPLLLVSAGKIPSWCRADSPPESVAGRLLVVPQVSESLLLAGWPARAKSEGAVVLRKQTSRQAIIDAALAELDEDLRTGSPVLADDFLALGFAYLQEELLTRQMRYMSSLDEVHFQAETLRAAEASVKQDVEATRQHLTNCFSVLTEARERFYPAETYLLDLTLVAPTTMGESLRASLQSPQPINLLATAETIAAMAREAPETLAALHAALKEGRADVIGGEYGEAELPLLPLESIVAEFRRGQEVYERHLGRGVKVYGRRRFGLTPVLPQLLVRLGFTGALHANLDDGQFPRAEQSKFRWEGVDSSALDAVARIPLDASRPESFLGLPTKMGETMDLDHVATMVFAHWPGQSSVWYDDLRRMSDYVPVLGKFVTAGEYFDQTQTSGRISKFKPDTYRAPYLKQAVIRKQPNPLSRFVEHYRRQALASGIEALETLVTLLRPGDGNAPPIGTSLRDVMTRDDDALQDALREATQSLAQVLPREQPGSDARRGSFIANPLSFSRRVGIELPAEMALPNVSGPVQAAQQQAGRKVAVVEVPAMGFAWIGPGAGEAPPPKPAAGGFWSRLKPGSAKTGDKSLVEGSTLRNEHMEVVIDERSGGIRALNDYRTRGNRLSQQLAFRLPSPRPKPGDVWHDPDLDAAYSSMVAQSVEVTASGPALGEIVTSGELRDPEGKRLAGYRQTYQLWRGSQVLLVQVELDVAEEPRVDPWNSYYAARFAWADETAELRRSVSWGGHATQAKRLESPLYVEMQTEKTRTAVLCGGLPYHRRVGDRMLDTLLVVRCETARRFRLGIGLDLSYPLPAALELLNPPLVVDDVGVSPKPAASSWLFHLDAKNIVATHWSPLVEEGRVAGFVVRLLETEGRAGRAKLRSFRPVARARQTDLRGETLADLRTEEDAVQLDFTAHEWLQIEARW